MTIVISQPLYATIRVHTSSITRAAEMYGPNSMRAHSQRLTIAAAKCPTCQQQTNAEPLNSSISQVDQPDSWWKVASDSS